MHDKLELPTDEKIELLKKPKDSPYIAEIKQSTTAMILLLDLGRGNKFNFQQSKVGLLLLTP